MRRLGAQQQLLAGYGAPSASAARAPPAQLLGRLGEGGGGTAATLPRSPLSGRHIRGAASSAGGDAAPDSGDARPLPAAPAADPLADLWFRNGVRFSCTECGRCCTGGDRAVFVNELEVQALLTHTKLPPATFGERYMRDVQGRAALAQNAAGDACVFLEGKRCGVYDARPTQCRTYPFWRENVLTAHDWEAEAVRCEGIATGAAAPPAVTHSGPDVTANVMFEEIHRSGENMAYSDMEPLLYGVAQEQGHLLMEFTEEVFGQFHQRVVYEDDTLKVLDTEDRVGAETVPGEETAGLVPRAYRTPCPTHITRALVFNAAPDFVQTAMPVYADGTPHTGGALLLAPHRALALSLALLSEPAFAAAVAARARARRGVARRTAGARVAVLGAGGGALPSALAAALPGATVDAVELSPAVCTAARDWFGFAASECLRLHQGDAVEFMEAAAAASPNSLSAVLLDVAAPAPPAADGLVVPPPEFVAPAFLRADGPVQRALAPGGVLAINAVAAAPQALAELEARLLEHFTCVWRVTPGAAFTVLLACNGDATADLSDSELWARARARPALAQLCAGMADSFSWERVLRDASPS